MGSIGPKQGIGIIQGKSRNDVALGRRRVGEPSLLFVSLGNTAGSAGVDLRVLDGAARFDHNRGS